jgi:hypothetical protein
MQNGFLVEKDDWFGEWAETNSDNEALPKIDQERDEWNYKSGYPMISCDIGDVYVTQALCDSGADTSIMSLELFNAIDDSTMTPTDTWIQLANSTLYQPEVMIDYMLIKIHDVYIAVDFLVVKTCGKNDIPLILGRPFSLDNQYTHYVGRNYSAGIRQEKYEFRLSSYNRRMQFHHKGDFTAETEEEKGTKASMEGEAIWGLQLRFSG